MVYTLNTFHPRTTNTPLHVGLIPDGTRRWAARNDVSLYDAYAQAMHKIAQYISFFFDEGSQAVSIYLCSLQNLKRPGAQLADLFRAEADLCIKILPQIAAKYETRISAAGKIELLPSFFSEAIKKIEQETSAYASRRIYLCVPYNPMDEIIEALRLANCPDDFLNHLWVPEPLDMIVRTSGANLLSNFLPLQAGYARLYIIDRLFNDTELSYLKKIVSDFKSLVRVYGD